MTKKLGVTMQNETCELGCWAHHTTPILSLHTIKVERDGLVRWSIYKNQRNWNYEAM